MTIFWGPDNTPELESFAPEQRRDLWRRHYRRSIASRRGVLAIGLYAAIVMCALLICDVSSMSIYVGIIAGNVIASPLLHGIIATDVRRRVAVVVADSARPR